MKITLLVTLLFGLVFLTTVGAAERTLTPQQQRMTSCNQQATAQALKGDARKTYMSDCLKNSKSAPGEKSLTPQQQKMRECNNQATQQSLKGDDRNKFMRVIPPPPAVAPSRPLTRPTVTCWRPCRPPGARMSIAQ